MCYFIGKNIEHQHHNKALLAMCVNFYHECWKNRCIVLHELLVKKKVLINKIEVLIEENRNANIVRMKEHVQLHEIDEEETNVVETLLWAKSTRKFKKV